MKILFVSDIHLKLRKEAEFEKNRFEKLFDFIEQQEVDVVILGGDIFDFKNPTLDEISVFYENVLKLPQDVIVISGNHETIDNETSTFTKLPQFGFKYYDITEEPLEYKNYHLYFVSHHNIKKIKNLKTKSTHYNVLFSHIRSNIGMIKQEIDVRRISKKFDQVFLGDIHIQYDPFDNVHYCGSPYTIQFEPQRQTGCFLIELKDEGVDYKFIDLSWLPQKIKLVATCKEYNNLVQALSKDNLYKIYLSCSVEEQFDVNVPKNVTIVFDKVIENIEEKVDEIVSFDGMDIVDALIELVQQDESITPEIFQKGVELLKDVTKRVSNG